MLKIYISTFHFTPLYVSTIMVKLPYSDTFQRDYDLKNCLIHQENQSNNFTIQSFEVLTLYSALGLSRSFVAPWQ